MTYATRAQKDNPNRMYTTVRGNLIDYPGKLTTPTANLATTKIMGKNFISTEEARYVLDNIKVFTSRPLSNAQST